MNNINEHLTQILNEASDSTILLVVPPFSLIDLPCIGLDILKNIADCMNIKTSVLYANMLFADYIGVEKYQLISRELMSMHTMLGERIFANAAYESMPCLGIDFMRRYDENFNQVFLNVSSIDKIKEVSDAAKEWSDILAEEIAKRDFRIVGVTSGHQQTNAAVALINAIKERNPNIICTMGGSGCDGDMSEGIITLSPKIDYVFSGESEISWQKFLENYQSEKLPEEKIIAGEVLSNLDEIVCDENTYYDYYNQLNILKLFSEDETSFLYESSRGCWWGEHHKCTFCGVNGWNKHYRFKSEQKVIDELTKMLMAHPKVKDIQMVDTLMPRNYFNKLLFTIKNKFPDITIFYEQRADLTLKQVVELKRSGIHFTQVGIEALSTNLLRLVNKGVDAEQNIKFLRYTKSAGLLIGWNLLTEIPNDQEADWVKVLELIPMIYHLNPPVLVRPLEIARFSPYYDDPERYNIKNIKPSGVYSEIFPKYANAEKIAWLFDADYRSDSKEDRELKKRIREEAEKWMDKWQHGNSNIPSLRIIKSNGIYFLEDSRFGNIIREAVTKSQAIVALYGQTQADADTLLWGEEKKVIYCYEGKYIPLATANPKIFEELENEL